MTTRKNIFNNFNSPTEQKLYEDLVNEFVQIWGIDAVYLPRSSQSESGFDLLMGDDPTKKYTDNYTIEVYVQSVDNFEGGELFSKFGLSVKKQARFLMPNRAFLREVDGEYTRPREGDLLWLSNFRALFEIKFVDEEHFFYDFGKKDFYGFSLVCEKFRYNDEVIYTGITEIDDTVNALKFVYNYNMNAGGRGTYKLGETVIQSNTASATVIAWNKPTGLLQLGNIVGQFLDNAAIVGLTSNANWILYSSETLNSVNHLLSDNQGIANEANTVLNFSEHDPFAGSF